jgi:peptidoglycan-N-acetylglucosamine deacetylase
MEPDARKPSATNLVGLSARFITGFIALLLISGALIYGGGVSSETRKKTSAKRAEPVKTISVTFDDLPVVRVYESKERRGITRRILNALHEREIESAGFVIGNNVDSDWELLAAWLEDGHVLGNHTNSHQDLHTTDAELFISDMVAGARTIESFLAGFGQKKRYFRYPFLHHGETQKTRDRIVSLLKENHTTIADVSVDTEDYLYNLTMESIRFSTDSTTFAKLREEYLEHILQALAKAEALSNQIGRRPVKQIMLLHVNRLNAMFLGDLLDAIAAEGYKFISFEEAIKDPIYRKKDNYLGPNGLSKLERIARSDPKFRPGEF